jgi:hypothetical protein
MVAELELDELDLTNGVEILDQVLFSYLGNGVLLGYGQPGGRP